MYSYNRKHIVLFSAFYPPHMGGVERYSECLAEELSQKGYKVTVVTSSLKCNQTKNDNVQIVYIPSITLLDDRMPVISPKALVSHNLRKLAKREITAVLIQTRYYPLSILGCAFARKLGLTPIVIDHSSGYLSNDRSLLGLLIRCYEKACTYVMLRYQPKFASVSLRSSQWLSSINLHVDCIVPNAINIGDYVSGASDVSWREILSCPDDLLIISAGRLIEEKGMLKLIEVAKRFQDESLQAHVVVAGEGPLEKQLTNLSCSHFSFVGKLDQQDLSALLRDADIFCLPTDYPEGLPTVLLEAAAQHCAIIVSNTGGAQEIVPNRNHGIILSSTAVDSIYAAIHSLYSDRDRLKLLKDSSYQNVKESYSWSATADKIIELCGIN